MMNRKTEYIKSKFNTLQTEIVQVLNYSGLVCRFNPKDLKKLEKWLRLDDCNKLYRLEHLKRHNYFYIENWDLQDLEYDGHGDISDLLPEYDDYYLCDIVFYKNGFMLKELNINQKEEVTQ